MTRLSILAPVLQTPRLTLRLPAEADFPAYRAYRLSPRSTIPESREDEALSWTLFAAFLGHWALRGFGRFVLVLRETGQAIGHAGPHRPEGQPENELTWTLWDKAHEGRGLAFEAARAVRDDAFGRLGWRTAVSYIARGNLRSERLAERLGAAPDPAAPCHDPAARVWRHRTGGVS